MFKILALLGIGLVVGLCSAHHTAYLTEWPAFSFWSYLPQGPGVFFGLGLALVYWASEKYTIAKKIGFTFGAPILGGVCYWLAVYTTIHLFQTNWSWLINLTVIAGIAACVATFIMMLGLQVLTREYSKKWIAACAAAGGILGGLFISSYPITAGVGIGGSTTEDLIGFIIFFIGWQVPMMALVGWPLTKNINAS